MSNIKINTASRLSAIAMGVLLSSMLLAPPTWANDSDWQDSTITGYDPSTRKVTILDWKPGQPKPKPPTPTPPHPCINYTTDTPRIGTPCPKPPKPSIPQIAQQAAASITLPLNTPIISPTPNQNQWGIIPIGYPIWLTTSDNQTTLTQTTTTQGLTITLTATRQNITFNMGDGNQTTCTDFTPRPPHNNPYQQSPTCGYTYLTTGQYTIAATTTWNITWQTSGQTGNLTITDTATTPTPLPIGELHTVITPNPPN